MATVSQVANRVVVAKAGFVCSAWVEVDGVAVPLYGLKDTPEGPEVYILNQEGRRFVVHYAVNTEPGYMAPEPTYKEMMVCCIIDGTGGKSETALREDSLNEEGVQGDFIGRDLPGATTQRFMFARPILTYLPTPEWTPLKLSKLGTVEVSFQRCKPARTKKGKGGGGKEVPVSLPINEDVAKEAGVGTVTGYGPIEPSDRTRFHIPPIYKVDVPNLVSVLFRHVTKQKLQTLGLIPRAQAVPAVRTKVEEKPARERLPSPDARRRPEKRPRIEDADDEKPVRRQLAPLAERSRAIQRTRVEDAEDEKPAMQNSNSRVVKKEVVCVDLTGLDD